MPMTFSHRRSIAALAFAAFIGAPSSDAVRCVASSFTPLAGFGVDSSRIDGVTADGQFVLGSATMLGVYTPQLTKWNRDGQPTLLTSEVVDDDVNRHAVPAAADGGVIVGTEFEYSQSTTRIEAFRWSAEQGIRRLGMFPANRDQKSVAYAASADGNVVVGASAWADGIDRAFRWTPSTGMAALDSHLPDGSGWSLATAISTDGKIIVGVAESDRGSVATRWTEHGLENLGELPGGDYGSLARDASADGSVVVGSSYSAASSPGSVEAFIWTRSTGMEPLGFLPNSTPLSEATLVSPDGTTVFGHSGYVIPSRTFVWDRRHGMRDFQQTLELDPLLAEYLAGWRLNGVSGISADGRTLVGNGINPSGSWQGWLLHLDQPLHIPEPSMLVLALGAAAYLLLSRRRPS